MLNTCPVCQFGHLKPVQAVYAQVYGETLIHAPHVPAWKCDVCGLSYFDPAAIRRIEVLVGEAGPPPNRHTSPANAPTDVEVSAPMDEADKSRLHPK